MAVTLNNVNEELVKFNNDIIRTFFREGRFDPYMGKSAGNIFRVIQDLASHGKQVNIPLVDNLRSDGVATGQLTGNEEAIDNYGMPLWHDWARNAVLWQKSTAKETVLNIRDLAGPDLSVWTKRIMLNDIVDTLLSIPTAQIPVGWHVGAGNRVNGVKWKDATSAQKNAWATANSDRLVYGQLAGNQVVGNVAASLANVGAASGRMSAAIGSLMKRTAAQTTNMGSWPAINPYMLKGTDQELYVCFMGSRAMRDLAADPAMYNANKDARPREGDPTKTNPIFTGSGFIKDGVIYKEIPEIDGRYIIGPMGTLTAQTGPLAGAGASGVDVSPVFLCGASAYAKVVGQQPKRTRRDETDYQFQTGLGVEMQYGFGKIAKDITANAGAVGTLKDFGVVTGFVAAPPDA